MIRKTYENTMHYIYDGERKGAKYSLDGEHWLNGGEYKECLAKHCLGLKPTKDANTRFDKGADIPELNASVKSWNCGLTDMKLGDEPEIFWNRFWAMTDSTQIYIWVSEQSGIVNLWFMSHREFQLVASEFAKWDDYCKKFRFKTCETKINEWLIKRA